MNRTEIDEKLKDNKLPEGWTKVKLDSLLIESKERNTTNKKLLVFSITNVKGFVLQDEYFSHNIHSEKTTNYKIFRENYFGYNPARINVGSIALSEKQREGLLSPMYIIFKTKSTLNPKYLKYFIQTSNFKNNVINNVAGSVRESLNYSSLEMFDFSYPISISEQNRIAEILETIDETIEKTDAIIEKYKRIKQGLMQDLFGNLASYGGSVEKLIKERIILEIQDGNHGEKHPKITDFIEDGIPFIMASDITENQINFNTCHHISEKQYNSLRIGFAKKNDVLLSHKASVGFTAIVPNKRIMLTPQVTYYRIANKNVLLPEYLFYYFQSKDFQKKIKDLAKQSTRDYIGIVSQRKNLEIYFPKNLEKQKEIINILSKIDLIIQKEKEYKEKLKRIKQGLMEDLLTGKVRVFNVN